MKHVIQRPVRTLCVLALALVLVCGSSLSAFAAQGTPSLNFEEMGSITLTLYSDEAQAPVIDCELTVYEVAGLSLENGNMTYRYRDAFAWCDAVLDDVTDPSLAGTLARYVQDHEVAGIQTEPVNGQGEATFQDLSLGLYLIIQTTESEGFYTVDPFLVTVPLAGEDGWIYHVNASPKVQVYPAPVVPETPEEEVPEELGPEPEVPAPETQETPVTPETPETPTAPALPQTGQLNWPIPLLAVAGMALVLLGFCLTRTGRRHTDAD